LLDKALIDSYDPPVIIVLLYSVWIAINKFKAISSTVVDSKSKVPRHVY
jgi:hypothetical protein